MYGRSKDVREVVVREAGVDQGDLLLTLVFAIQRGRLAGRTCVRALLGPPGRLHRYNTGEMWHLEVTISRNCLSRHFCFWGGWRSVPVCVCVDKGIPTWHLFIQVDRSSSSNKANKNLLRHSMMRQKYFLYVACLNKFKFKKIKWKIPLVFVLSLHDFVTWWYARIKRNEKLDDFQPILINWKSHHRPWSPINPNHVK